MRNLHARLSKRPRRRLLRLAARFSLVFLRKKFCHRLRLSVCLMYKKFATNGESKMANMAEISSKKPSDLDGQPNFFLGATEETFPSPTSLQRTARVSSLEQYSDWYQKSLDDPETFWTNILSREAKFHFATPPTKGKFLEYNFDIRRGNIFIRCMTGAKLNVCYNVLDRWVNDEGIGDKVAFFWEGNALDDSYQITYKELLVLVNKFGIVLRRKGVKKGDRVAIYLPMIVELVVAMLACARIGAVHSIVFGGFSAESLATRILDAKADVLVTADGVWRGPKLVRLKEIADEAIGRCQKENHPLKHVIVVKHVALPPRGSSNGESTEMKPGKRPCLDLKVELSGGQTWYHDEMAAVSDGEQCPVEWMDAEDPLFMLYTSGSTGRPKGVVHTQAGYLLYAFTTFRYVFDYQPDDVYFCTADIGWITGHSYVTYGPLANGATSVIFEGIPLYPDPGRFWAIIDKYSVTKFYTAPTAIRALMKHGNGFVQRYSRKSLTVLGTVGEPINPEAWLWYNDVVGDKRCAIVDTYWQTETGGHLLTPLPGCTTMKPGSATFPFFGVDPAILNEEGIEIEGAGEGYLVFKRPWPGIMRTVYGDHKRFEETYFSRFPGYYFTGDGCRRDEDGYYWITGRVDDMMNVSGHLLSTAELESALVSHPAVAEAAVVAAPHDLKGQAPYCFVTLKNGYDFTQKLVKELQDVCRSKIGAVAVPEFLQNAPGLPKTRSGKIMRRILRKVAAGEKEDFGDTSTLAEESVVLDLVKNRIEANSK